MSQKLFTKVVLANAKNYPLYSQDSKGDETVFWAKFFDPCGRYTFYVSEMEVEVISELGMRQMVEGTAFGYVVSPLGPDCDELGYTDLNEMSTVKNRYGLTMERDMHFSPMTMGELKAKNWSA